MDRLLFDILFHAYIGFLLSWPLFTLATLWLLRRRKMTAAAQAFWALIILVIPILGAVAFLVVQPGENL